MIGQDVDAAALLARAAKGLAVKVYRAADGPWHAHVSGVRQRDLDGLEMRVSSVSARHIAAMIERDMADGMDLSSALAARRSRYAVAEVGGNGWCSVGFCSTEQEARERACEVVGYVIGRRLARETGPRVVPARVVPGLRAVAL